MGPAGCNFLSQPQASLSTLRSYHHSIRFMSEKIAISDHGPPEFLSPLPLDSMGSIESTFIHDGMYYRDPLTVDGQPFERAGPREHLYFEPARTKVAIVTCGGLCPGLNNVIRSLYL